MTEYQLNQLTTAQLAEFACSRATFLIAVDHPPVKIELYHTGSHFVEVSYALRRKANQNAEWQLYCANHYPDAPASTKYLTLYLDKIDLAPC